jgi:uncharacterized protein (TIGR03790 family)
MTFSRFGALFSAICMVGMLHGSTVAWAGGGPENVLLVVNSKSWQSRTVANHFAALRKIPDGNVLAIPWKGPLNKEASLQDFRKEILAPILNAVASRGLAGQIDYVVYSCDFPEAIDFSADTRGQTLGKPYDKMVASINGLTYFYQKAIRGDLNLISLRSNQYMRRADGVARDDRARGFRSWHGWGVGGATDDSGDRYMLSMMLGATTVRGNKLEEIISYLQRSAAADGTRPSGAIYYVANDNVRSKTRQFSAGGASVDKFNAAVAQLQSSGVRAEKIDGKIPVGRIDVAGAMVGTASFDWSASRSHILPGAICEHLTSFGGILRRGSGQTPLSEWLRHGAAASSGTVVEPYAIQDKFPHPMIQVYYAQGCSAAEAFYQSVFGPYQLLIVGDPLCQPWAEIPDVTVDGVAAGGKISGEIVLHPSARFRRGDRAKRFELFVDGRRFAKCRPGGDLKIDSRLFPDGYHELRVVAIGDSLIETQGRAIVESWFNNHDRQIDVRVAPRRQVGWEQPIAVVVEANGVDEIVIQHHAATVGESIAGEKGTLNIDSKLLGQGPATIQAIGFIGKGAGRRVVVVSKPTTITVVDSRRGRP